ncbi:MAG: membrane dipeptidase [Paraglaciecola sp.]|jgi:membrane dipeptidase
MKNYKKIGLLLASSAFFSVNILAIEASDKAIKLAQDNILIDSHIDVPYRLQEKWEDVTQATEGGDFDYPRAKKGGLNAPFMSIYVPASLDNSPASTALADKLIDYVEAIVGRAPDKFAIAKSVDDVNEQFNQGLISLPLGMENGSPIQGDLANLHHFYARGIRYITLAHSQANHISDSSYDIRRKWKGLSPFGKELIGEMNNIGVMVDISHVSDAAFYQVMELSKAPVIASHSSLRSFTPGFERNMDDDMVKALAKNGGVIQINFGSGFVSKMARSWRDKMSQQKDALEAKLGKENEQLKSFDDSYRAKSPYPYATLDSVLDHIDHVVDLVGIDHVGIGSDYDGVGDSLPVDLKDVSSYPNLVQGLLNRDYSDEDIRKVLGANFLRVWSAVEEYAAKH